ncbi:CPBP family intramembrane metalloprotease [candidate division WOR-3 bacterium]|nr:CPBP family intramembrane metalloprotease [candidate division WOR-3 bacterium]
MIKEYIKEIKQFDMETVIIIIYSTFILLFGIYLRRGQFIFPRPVYLNRLIILGIIYGLSPFLLFFIFKHKPKDFGISLGHIKKWLKEVLFFYLLMVVILVLAFKFTNLKNVYPLYRKAAQGWNYFLLYQLIQLFHMFTWEFFFRGFMLFGLEKKFGRASILIQTIPFAIMHYRKHQLEAYGSIFAGIFLGIIGLRARSFLPCAILHFLVALTADMLGILF